MKVAVYWTRKYAIGQGKKWYNELFTSVTEFHFDNETGVFKLIHHGETVEFHRTDAHWVKMEL